VVLLLKLRIAFRAQGAGGVVEILSGVESSDHFTLTVINDATLRHVVASIAVGVGTGFRGSLFQFHGSSCPKKSRKAEA
jgi:hypothetical protein